MSPHTETRTVFEVTGTVYPLPLDVEHNLLRIGQEALTNVFKYARANTIQIELIYEAAQFILRVNDNGQGFDKESSCFSNGFGFLGMRERADRIGAKLVVNSQSGKGTEVIVSINRL
jgi:signal transduction histidine kinase